MLARPLEDAHGLYGPTFSRTVWRMYGGAKGAARCSHGRSKMRTASPCSTELSRRFCSCSPTCAPQGSNVRGPHEGYIAYSNSLRKYSIVVSPACGALSPTAGLVKGMQCTRLRWALVFVLKARGRAEDLVGPKRPPPSNRVNVKTTSGVPRFHVPGLGLARTPPGSLGVAPLNVD